MLYLSKGQKFIADAASHCVQHILADLIAFERKAHIAKFFDSTDTFDDASAQHRRHSRLKLPSSWNPPLDNGIAVACAALRRALVQHYIPKPRRPNTGWLDRQAAAWLRRNREKFCIIDADKGLGDVLVPRDWTQLEMRRLVAEGFHKLSADAYAAQSIDARVALHHIVSAAQDSKTISTRLAAFLLHDVSSEVVGRFRIRLKIHKTPNVGRPIANLTRCWLSPCYKLLVEVLKPIQASLPYVVDGSSSFSTAVPRRLDETNELATVDVRNLYPSIDTEHLIVVVSLAITKHYHGNSNYIDFAVKILALVLKHQIIEFEDSHFSGHGIATGLDPGVLLANIYLAPLDEHIVNTLNPCFYFRYVDDSVICSEVVDEALVLLNGFHPSISWEITARGGRSAQHEPAVPFLDLELSIHNSHLVTKTFQKPLNEYLYVPRSSCHPQSCFRGLIRGEILRYIRTNSCIRDCRNVIDLFRQRLFRRGYDATEIDTCISEVFRHLRFSRFAAVRLKSAKQLFFTTTYSSTLNIRVIKMCLKKFEPRFSSRFTHSIVLQLSHRVQPNRFQRLYRDNWLSRCWQNVSHTNAACMHRALYRVRGSGTSSS